MAVSTYQPRAGLGHALRKFWLPFTFLLPAAVIMIAFMIIPMIRTIILSFQSWNGLTPATWVGLGNYQDLLQDSLFQGALEHTALFVVVTVVFQTVIPLLVAMLVISKIRGSVLFRTIYFMPVIISLAVSGLLWSIIYDPINGALNNVLTDIGLKSLTQQWLANTSTVLPSIMVVSIWQSMGFYLLIFVAGLQGIPQEMLEAAAIDGANAWQRFLKVTIPLLGPIITVVVVLNTINGIKAFDQIWVMTAGGPAHASDTLATYLYYSAFGAYGSANPELGYASTIGVVILVLSAVISIAQIRLGRSEAIEY
jgi:ABC-type sugar transport system permease subunit